MEGGGNQNLLIEHKENITQYGNKGEASFLSLTLSFSNWSTPYSEL